MTTDSEDTEDYEFPQHEPDPDFDFVLHDLDRQGWIDEHKAVYLSDVVSGRVPRPPFLFDDFLLSHSITLVSGEPFAGKTMFMLAVMVSLDSGEPLFGTFHPAPHQRGLFVGQDAPTWDYLTQAQKLSRGLGETKQGESLLVLNGGYNVLEPRFLKMIEEAIDYHSITFLMLDTLLEFHSLDENSNNDMRRVMGLMKHLRDKHHISIFLSTHTAKSTEGKSANYRARGASVIAGSVDQHVLIRQHFGGGKADGFYFKIPKSRGASQPEDSQVVKFVPTDNGGLKLEYSGELYSSRQEILLRALSGGHTARKKIVELLGQANPGWNKLELERRTTNSLKFLEMKGLVQKIDRGIYALTPAGEKNLESLNRGQES
jgi:AAA domain-containing protein